jgi:hypothetical protein
MTSGNPTPRHARAQDTEPAPSRGQASGLLRKLLERVGAKEVRPDTGAKPLPPSGGRSGEGAQSVKPFLEEARNSRPGPLE